MNDERKRLKELYNNLKADNYDLPEYETFESDMADDNMMRQLYDNIKADNYDVPDYETFRGDMGYGSYQQPAEQPQGLPVNPATFAPMAQPRQQAPNVRAPFANEEAQRQYEQQRATAQPKPQPTQEQAQPLGPEKFQREMEMQQAVDRLYDTHSQMLNAMREKHMPFSKQEDVLAPARKQRMQEEQKSATRVQLDELEGEVNNRIAEIQTAAASEWRERDNNRGFWGNVARALSESPDKTGGVAEETARMYEQHPELKELTAASRAIRNAKQVIAEADHNAKEGTFESSWFAGLGRGFGQKLSDVNTWDMGITSVQDNSAILKALEAFDRGEPLTESQQALLDAKAIELCVNEFFGSEVGRGYKAGATTAEAIPFMVEMVANPLSSVGKGATKMMAKYAVKRFGKQAAKKAGSKLFRGGIRSIADVLSAGGMTATTGGIGTYAGALDRMIGDIKYDTDKNGNIVFAGHENMDDPLTALGKEFTSQTIERWSEMAGVYNEFIPKTLGKLMGKGFNKIGLGAVTSFFERVPKTQWGKAIGNFMEKTQWHGPVGEFLEEIEGGTANALMHIDQTLDTNPETGVFNKDNLIDTFEGVAVMGVMFAGAGTVGYIRGRANLSKANKQAELLFGNYWPEIRDLMTNGSAAERHAIMEKVLNDPTATEAQKRAMLDYDKWMLANAMRENVTDRVYADPSEMAAGVSFDNGYFEYDDEESRMDAFINLGLSEERLRGMLGDETFGRLEEAPIDVQAELEKSGKMTAEQRKAVSDYISFKYAVDGINDRINDDADMMAEQQREESRRRQFRGEGENKGALRPVTITMRDGEQREVYLTQGELALTESGLVDPEKTKELNNVGTLTAYDPVEGKEVSFAPSDIVEVGQMTTAEQQELNIEANKQANIQQQQDAATGRFDPQPGQQIEVPDMGTATVLATDGETVTLQMPDGTQQSMAIADIQQIADGVAMEDYRQRHPEAVESGERRVESAAPEGAAAEQTTSKIEGTPEEFVSGMTLTVTDREGNEHTVTTDGKRYTYNPMSGELTESENGNYLKMTDENGEVLTYDLSGRGYGSAQEIKDYEMPKEEQKDAWDEYWKKNGIPFNEEQPTEETVPSFKEEGEKPTWPEQEPKDDVERTHYGDTQMVEPQPEPVPEQPAVEPMPMHTVGKGKEKKEEEDWMATTPERAYTYLYEEAVGLGLPVKTVDNIVANNLKKAQDKVKRAETATGSIVGVLQKQNAAKAEVEYWEKVQKLRSQAMLAAAEAEAERTKEQRAAEAQRAAERREQRRNTEVGEAGSTPAEKYNSSNKIVGNKVSRTIADKTKIKGHYVLVEADALTPSHDPFNGWKVSEGFPTTEDGKSVNDRVYEGDKEAQDFTESIAQVYDGQAVSEIPVVSSEGIVYDGNGRTMAGQIAARNNTDGEYIEALTENAANFGFTEEQVQSMSHPRVVMQVDEDMPYNATTFARFNKDSKKKMNNVNKAVSIGKQMTDSARDAMLEIIDRYGTIDTFFGSEMAAADVVNMLVDGGFITQQEVPAFREKNSEGKMLLSADGRSFVTNTLLGTLFDEEAIRKLGNDKGLQNSLLRAIPQIAENRRLGEYALTDEINTTIDLLYEARKSGMSFDLFKRQGNLVEGLVEDRYEPMVVIMADLMSSGVDNFREFLTLYNQSAAADAASGGENLFGRRTKEDLKNAAVEYYKAQRNGQTDNTQTTAADTGRNENAETQPGVGGIQESEGDRGTAAEQPAGEVAESREERDKRLEEERKQRILSEGTSFDKPFALTPVSETMTADEIGANVRRIVEGLKANEGNGTLDTFEGFAYNGNYKKNAGHQVDEYLVSLTGVVPDATLRQWYESEGLKTRDDLRAFGEKLYAEQPEKGASPIGNQTDTPISNQGEGSIENRTKDRMEQLTTRWRNIFRHNTPNPIEDIDKAIEEQNKTIDAINNGQTKAGPFDLMPKEHYEDNKRELEELKALVEQYGLPEIEEPVVKTEGADKPLQKLSDVKKFMQSIGYKGSMSNTMTSSSTGKKIVKYYANGVVTPTITLGETTPRDIWQQFHLYGNVMDVDIPADIKAELDRISDAAKGASDALWSDEREHVKNILTEAGIPFTDVIDSERGVRIVFTDRKNDNGNYVDYTDYADAEQVRDSLNFIRAKAEKMQPKQHKTGGNATKTSERDRSLLEVVMDKLRNIIGDRLHTSLTEDEKRMINWARAAYHRVFHGSGADFERFDSSHMGEGEGAQAYGYGHYTTEVEGIGRTYAGQVDGYVNHNGRKLNYYDGIEISKAMDFAVKAMINARGDKAKAVDIINKNKASSLYPQFNKNLDEAIELINNGEVEYVETKSPTLYTVDIPDDNGSNYLSWNKTLPKEQRRRIAEAVRGLEGEPAESVKYPKYKGGWQQLADMIERNQWAYQEVRDRLVQAFGGRIADEKRVSDLMHTAGFTGIKYPAQYRSGGREDNAKNYVIFDDGDLKIIDKIKFFKTPQGEVFGFTVGGNIYVDMDIAKADTPIHEYGHLWVPMVRESDPEMWEDIKRVLTKDKDVKPFMDIVRQRYPELTAEGREDDFMEEVFTHFSGDNGLKMLEEAAREYEEQDGQGFISKAKAIAALNKVKEALDKFWGKVAQLFGIKFRNAREVANKMFKDFMDEVDPTKVRTERIKNEGLKPEEEKTLMGVHNISEEKLRKALKQGGFANPSMAVIDTKHHMHNDYGEISLIPKSSLIDARTGKNAGTFTADAWTPSYPQTRLRPTNNGVSKFYKDLQDIDDKVSSELGSKLRLYFDSYLDGRDPDAMYWWYLYERGKNPNVATYGNVFGKEITDKVMGVLDNGKKSIFDLSKEEMEQLVNTYHDYKRKKGEEVVPAEERIAKMQQRLNSQTGDDPKLQPVRDRIRKNIEEIEQYGEFLSNLDNFVEGVQNTLRRENELDHYTTFSDARKRVENECLKNDFNKWLEEINDRYGIESYVFNGYDYYGNQKWVKNTLKNVSKLMKQEGLNGATGVSGIGNWIARVAKKVKTLDQIRAEKGNLKATQEENDAFRSKWADILYDISRKLDENDTFVGDNRMSEALDHANPADYIKQEYGIDLPKKDREAIDTFIKEVRETFPTGYFETKFERPVMLDEFAVAVVPEGTSQDVVDALKNAGLDVRTYDGTSENRQAVTLDAVKGRDDIMFQKADNKSTEREVEPYKAPKKNDGEDLIDYAKRVAEDYQGYEDKKKNSNGGIERAVESAKEAAEENKGEADKLKADYEAIGGKLADLRKAMSLQKKFDAGTVRRVTDLALSLIKNGQMDNLRANDVSRLLSAVYNSTGKDDIEDNLRRVVDIMIDSQLRNAEERLHKLESIRGSKVDAKGVQVQGRLDVAGQRMVDAFKKGRAMQMKDLDDRIADAQERMGSDDKVTADEATMEYAGLQMAKDYIEKIQQSENDVEEIYSQIRQTEREIKDEESKIYDYVSTPMKDAEGNEIMKNDGSGPRMHTVRTLKPEFKENVTEENQRILDDTKRSIKQKKESIAAMEESISKAKIERMNDFNELVSRLSGQMNESIANAKAWAEEQKERVKEIQHNANSDMQGKSAIEHRKKGETRFERVNNLAGNFLFAPLSTFSEMMRLFGAKNANGEGYLYNRFVRGLIDARQKEVKGVRTKYGILDKKAHEVFGDKVNSWADLMNEVGKMPKMNVRWNDGGEMKDHELHQGNLMYIYMVDKMTDGRMKLRKMGIDEATMEEIKANLDPRLKEIADWLQDEFLTDTRKEYNETHKRMFGASMASIENYFPLVINDASRAKDAEKEDERGQNTNIISTTTGAVKKRTLNTTALDLLNADALHVILDHIGKMEHWNAFAEYNRDLNALRSYKRFENQVKNMRTIYGNGDNLWKKFNNVAQMATGSYIPKHGDFDKAMLEFATGVTAAKVSFRINTALKQLLSLPAYLPYLNAKGFWKSISNNLSNKETSFKWAMEHLPLFEERWKSRVSGDPRLAQTVMDWQSGHANLVGNIARIGMLPNAAVDALTVSIGAHAVYETRKAQYLKEGYSEEAAEKRAIQDAEIAYNETQQSSEGGFLSTMQVDRTWETVLFSVFRNASMAYQRQLHGALRNIGHNLTKQQREQTIEFMTKQLVRDGVPEEKAEETAKKRFARQMRKNAIAVATFGYIVQFAWNFGGKMWELLFGDDDDDKEETWKDIAVQSLFGGVEGLTGGDVMSEFGRQIVRNDYTPNKLDKDMPLSSDLATMLQKFGQGRTGEALNDIVDLAVQAGLGFNPQTLTDGVYAIVDAANGDLGLAREAMLAAMRIINVPQSQTKKLYFDEIGMSGEEASKLTFEELAERYAKYQVKRTHPFTFWAWDDEKLLGKYENQGNTIMKEKVSHMDDEQAKEVLERNYNQGGEKTRKLAGQMEAKRQGVNNLQAAKSDYEKIYRNKNSYVDMAEDYMLKAAIKEAKDEGDKERQQTLEAYSRSIANLKKDLADTYSDVDEVLNDIRELRKEALEYNDRNQ